ncbi:MAG: hypothetical protein L0312_15880 [Acidobacteria bacterium]|nr:hypothetical protein [Acidobacteriota bacterium]
MTAATAYKVHVKLGQAEFSAEGPEETVKAQLASFLGLAAAQPIPPHQINGNGHSNGNGNGAHSAPPGESAHTDVDPTVVARLFKEDRNGAISLRTLPKTEQRNADALLLLLWGHLVRKEQVEVRAKELIAGMRQSGVPNLTRVDEILVKYDMYVTSGGVRRGKWYSLTNPGIECAENLAKGMGL